MRNGFGKITYSAPVSEYKSYEGFWKDDSWHGQGKSIDKNDNVYEGEFIGDRRHGQGWMQYANGDSYDGGWVDGRKQGTGILLLARGTKYQGATKPPLHCCRISTVEF